MYCSKCGNEINEGSLFCPKCGEKVDTRVNNDEQSPIVEDNVVSNDRAVEKTTEVKELEIKGGKTFIFNGIMNSSYTTTIVNNNDNINVNMIEKRMIKDKHRIDNFEFSRKNLLNVTMKNKIRKSGIFYFQIIFSLLLIFTGALILPGIAIILYSLWIALHKIAKIELKNGQSIEIYIRGKDDYNKLVDFLLNNKG